MGQRQLMLPGMDPGPPRPRPKAIRPRRRKVRPPRDPRRRSLSLPQIRAHLLRRWQHADGRPLSEAEAEAAWLSFDWWRRMDTSRCPLHRPKERSRPIGRNRANLDRWMRLETDSHPRTSSCSS